MGGTRGLMRSEVHRSHWYLRVVTNSGNACMDTWLCKQCGRAADVQVVTAQLGQPWPVWASRAQYRPVVVSLGQSWLLSVQPWSVQVSCVQYRPVVVTVGQIISEARPHLVNVSQLVWCKQETTRHSWWTHRACQSLLQDVSAGVDFLLEAGLINLNHAALTCRLPRPRCVGRTSRWLT
jgi:hypothetical protein